MVGFGGADFFEGWEGVGAGGAVAEEAYESEAAVEEAGDGGSVAEEVVEGFVGAARSGGFEDVDAGCGGDY